MSKPASLLKGFEKDVATAKPSAKRSVIFDKSTTGLALIVTPKGKKSFSIVARDSEGKQVWAKIGDPAVMSVAEARQEAPQAVARVKAGQAPVIPPLAPEAAPATFQQVAERFIAKWVETGGKNQDGVPLRSAREIKRHFSTYLYSRWGSKPFVSIRRGQVTELIDDMVLTNGPVQADRVLATLAKLFNWYRQYDEYYVSPIIAEMKRSGSHTARARKRILTDDEIRALWAACEGEGVFGAFLKVSLLTGQRRAKVAGMKWTDIDAGVWHIAAEAREKVNAGSFKLPTMALDIIEAQPRVGSNPFVFAGRGNKAMNAFSAAKKEMSAKLTIAPWVVHDLRRTARSLMARAGVRSDVAERTLGHVIHGVEGVYDRYTYQAEKGEALVALATLIGRILEGDADNVVEIGAAR